MQKIIRAVEQEKKVQGVVERYRQRLMLEDMAGKCHTMQLCDVVVDFKGWLKDEMETCRGSMKLSTISWRLGVLRLCPKVCLEGIPEWINLKEEVQMIAAGLGFRHRIVSEAAKKLGISTHSADGVRKNKNELAAEVRRVKVPKRKYTQLKDEVKRLGGSLRIYEDGKQRRLKQPELQAEYDRLANAVEGERKEKHAGGNTSKRGNKRRKPTSSGG